MTATSADAATESSGGPDADAKLLASAGQARSLPARSVLCEEGEVTDCFFLVTAGEFIIAKRIAGEETRLSTFGPGSLLAVMPALDGAPCGVTISALNDATVVAIKRERLLTLLEQADPNSGLANLLSLLAIRRLRGATNELSQALLCALRSPERPGRLDALRLARIQAGSYAWLG
jgi:CRP-like cAMP-binding protein